MKTIRIELSTKGIEDALSSLEDLKKRLKLHNAEFLERMGEMGVEIASEKFFNAIYDGYNDVEVHQEPRSDDSVAIVADGNATLFIEFGSGITYPDSHPEAAELGMKHGDYGYHLGRNPGGWRYTGFPGTNGEEIKEGPHAGEIHTYGNPANMCMYLTVNDLERESPDIATRAFVK